MVRGESTSPAVGQKPTQLCTLAIMYICTALLLSSCGRPDASGIYVAASDREAVLVQLVETKDGNVTGRMEAVSIGPNGVVSYRSAPIDGAASDHDLMFKPASVWYGGLSETGTFSSSGLTLNGSGSTLNAQRSDLNNYRAAVAHIQSIAAVERQRIADLRAQQAARTAQQAARNVSEKIAAVEAATAQVHNDTTKMDAGIANCPDFGKRSAMNTERIAKMLRIAPTLSGLNRSQLAVQASQIEVDTNQIEVARSQYAIALNQVVQDAAPLAQRLQQFCNAPHDTQFDQSCVGANSAAADFQAALSRGRNSFNGFKQAIQLELDRQSAMIQRMGN